MRVAVLSDIHGNLTALEAVIADLAVQRADVVINGGDLVGSGPRPAEVVDLVASLGWPSVAGNTDEVLWNERPFEELRARLPQMKKMLDCVADDVAWTQAAVGGGRMASLVKTPMQWTNGDLTVVHARPGDTWSSPQAGADEKEFTDAYGGLGSPVVVYGHVHVPFVREVPSMIVANSGSVGMPHDGDQRASYLLIDDGRPTIRRVAYEVESEIRELSVRGHPHAEWIASILRAASFVRV
jgi:predicted phosphodiesterase